MLVSKSSQQICGVSWDSSCPSIQIVDGSPLSLEEERVMSKDTTDISPSGNMPTTGASPGSHLAFPRYTWSANEHLDPLKRWALKSRSCSDQRSGCRDISQDNCVRQTCCVPGGYAWHGQDSDWLPGEHIGCRTPSPLAVPVPWSLDLVKIPAF